MFYSLKYKLLFIASPKSGTVSVHEALEKLDPNGERRRIVVGDKVITGSDLDQGIIGHARAREIKEALGAEDYGTLESMAFIRNPYEKLVSSYFFNKTNNLGQAFRINGRSHRFKRSVNHFLTTLLAKVLPFKIWALFYPYRSNVSYMTDYDGSVIVKHLGRTEYLHQDFQRIMKSLNIDASHIQVGKRNTSKHDAHEHYFKARWFRVLMDRKMKGDVEFYKKVCLAMQ